MASETGSQSKDEGSSPSSQESPAASSRAEKDSSNSEAPGSNPPTPPADVQPSPNEDTENEKPPMSTSTEAEAEPGEVLDSESAPPLPKEPLPEQDDGWEPVWSAEAGSWYFFNKLTQQTQWENPRVPSEPQGAPGTSAAPPRHQPPPPVLGGYNPAIHGDYDPNASYAQAYEQRTDEDAEPSEPLDPSALHASASQFNRATGKFQSEGQGPDRHGDEAKSRRQMSAFFDVDAAANAHDGRSLKAERAGKKPSKAELKAFKEKRRAKKEEKRRAWLRD